jgi:hypothetical protein
MLRAKTQTEEGCYGEPFFSRGSVSYVILAFVLSLGVSGV